VQKSRILNTAEINVLFVKANRFLTKENVNKEKVRIRTEIKATYIQRSAGGVYKISEEDESPEQ